MRADGDLTVRRQGVGGEVAAKVKACPDGWMHGAHRVLLLVHGYNNNQVEASDAFDKFLENLPTLAGRAGRFFWPGDADFGAVQWLDFLSYPTEIPDAKSSARRLATYLAEQVRANPAQELVLVGHSLGCRLVLETLDLYATGAVAPVPNVRLVLLMAAAVPVRLSRAGERLWRAAHASGDCLVLYSPDDPVLRFAFPLGQTLARVLGFEKAVYLRAVGLHGEPHGFATETPKQACGNGHGDYWPDPDAAAYLAGKLGAAVAHSLKERCLPEYDVAKSRRLEERTLPARKPVAGRPVCLAG